MNRFCNLINWPHVSVLAGNEFADYGNQNANYGNIFILNVSVKVWVSNVIRFNCLSVSHTTTACRAIRTHSSWFLHLSVRCNITCTFFIIHLFIDKLLRVLYYIQTRSVLQTVYFCNGVYETLNTEQVHYIQRVEEMNSGKIKTFTIKLDYNCCSEFLSVLRSMAKEHFYIKIAAGP